MTIFNVKIKLTDILFIFALTFVLAFPTPSRTKAIAIVIFFSFMMLVKLANWNSIKNDIHLFGCFLFLGYAYLSKEWALFPKAVDEQITNVLWTVMLATAISTYISYNQYDLEDIVKRFLPIVLLFMINIAVNGTFHKDRLSIGINENAFGRIASGMFCLLFYQCKREQWKKKYMNILAASCLLMVLLSGSRTSMLMTALYGIAILAFEHPTKDTLKLLGRLLTGAIICVIGYFVVTRINFLYTSIGHRVESMFDLLLGVSEGDGSAITRMSMIESAQALFEKHPWLGAGMNNFKYVTEHGTYAHNNFYELASCLGIVGLVIYYSPLIKNLLNALRRWRKDEDGMILPLILIVSFLMGDIGGVSYFSPYAHVYAALAIGMLSTRAVQQIRK